MCGIGAILDPAGTAPAGAGEAMTRALRHRGPDGAGVSDLGPALLAHTRLAIIDVAGGDQPLVSEDGACTAIVNGEIYNHLELRRELEAAGHRFATRSDSEVVLHAYEQHGPECVRRLNGIFAFALWDARRRRLVAARDHYGVKPLYWWSDGRRVALASEVRALLAAGLVRAELDPVALDHYLALRFVPSPRTMFRGVRKLPPASLLVADERGVRVESWREPPDAPLGGSDADELAGELRQRFLDAVERQMMSDVPYGAFLSGGVDSAGVVAAMARRGGGPPTTFTIGFPGHGPVLDEREHAAETARALGTEHHATAMEQADFLGQLETCVRSLEEPCAIPSAPALMQLSAFASRSVKVVLSGQGADEPFGGYGRHKAAALLGVVGRLPTALAGPAARAAAALPRNEQLKRGARLLGDLDDTGRLLRLFEVTPRELRTELAGPALAAGDGERRDAIRDVAADVGDRDLLEQALYVDTHVFLPDRLLVCADKVSMAASLEQRVPFLDVELMRFVQRIPARRRMRRLSGKWLHRRALAPLVPEPALRRPKHGFSTPYDRWLRESLGAEVERRFAAGGELSQLIAPAAVARLAARHRSGRDDHKAILYALLELAVWHRTFIEREAPVASGSTA